MNPPRAIVLLLLVALGPACSKEYPNPFAEIGSILAPKPEAALLLTSAVYSLQPGAARELYALNADGSGLGRLTFCNAQSPRCDTMEAISGPDRKRAVVRRVTDSNNDGILSAAADGEALVYIDLERGVEATIVPASRHVSGADWSPAAEIIAYTGLGEGDTEDLWRVDLNGANPVNLTASNLVRERRPRIDPTGTAAVFERIDATGKGQIWIFNTSVLQVRVTSGGPGTEALAGTPYVVGADADPDYAPDGRSIVFRRLTGTGNGGLGTWDLLRVATDGSGLTVLATGPVFRGAPDWSRLGIAFTEVDSAGGTAQLVQIQADGSGRKVLLTQGAAFGLGFPRWLP